MIIKIKQILGNIFQNYNLHWNMVTKLQKFTKYYNLNKQISGLKILLMKELNKELKLHNKVIMWSLKLKKLKWIVVMEKCIKIVWNKLIIKF